VIKYAAKAEEITASIYRLAPGLLGSHVSRGAEDGTDLSEARLLADPAGKAEVQYLDSLPLAFEPDICRLDVPVDQMVGVRGRQTLCRFPTDAKSFVRWTFPFSVQAVVECFTLEQRHRQERDASIGSDLENWDDVIMFNPGSCLPFPKEPLAMNFGNGQCREHDLEGDRPFQVYVLGVKNHTHPADAQDLQDPIRT
jgi:hypothetical protein